MSVGRRGKPQKLFEKLVSPIAILPGQFYCCFINVRRFVKYLYTISIKTKSHFPEKDTTKRSGERTNKPKPPDTLTTTNCSNHIYTTSIALPLPLSKKVLPTPAPFNAISNKSDLWDRFALKENGSVGVDEISLTLPLLPHRSDVVNRRRVAAVDFERPFPWSEGGALLILMSHHFASYCTVCPLRCHPQNTLFVGSPPVSTHV
ncbi:hypothetical protein NPIL_672071 [Nephila pilipes]|uniref:Uncharacterized protein n=1 Tax=Nephila pilipes TaxID=299642 RepID=A0A8X6NU71_NEPPI|nr:hypothetical protein NPIL_672071 [Nephila pilipes]